MEPPRRLAQQVGDDAGRFEEIGLAPGTECISCVLIGGPFDGASLGVALPLPPSAVVVEHAYRQRSPLFPERYYHDSVRERTEPQ